MKRNQGHIIYIYYDVKYVKKKKKNAEQMTENVP